MSSEAREWVWENSSSKGAGRLVMLSIADRVTDEQCIAWASLTSLEERTNSSRSTVREALDRLLASGELEQLDDLVGPQRSTVYRLPLAAKAIAQATMEQASDDTSMDEPEAEPTLRISALRRCGIRPREVPESPGTVRNPAGPESGRSGIRYLTTETGTATYRKPAQRCTGNRSPEP
ncbi:hypothetical protein [Streptomyces sp. bgisy130]|uniref:hypothetical protein n=1 Tax=Streptomyces sp. bgisy130 TaxID=3413788 RepID=UPI003F4A5A46